MSETEAYTMPDDDAPRPPKVKAERPIEVFTEGEDIHAIKESAAMAKRAIRERWPVDPAIMRRVIARADALVQKTTKTVATTMGPVEVDADDGALAAMKVILAANAQNQADDHVEEKNKRLDEGKATENVTERVITVEFDKRG